jgi:hypothetical protein
VLYANDTSVLITANYLKDLPIRSASIPNYISKQFAVKGLSPSTNKTNVITFNFNHLQNYIFQILYQDKENEVTNIKFLGLGIYKGMEWKTYTEQII